MLAITPVAMSMIPTTIANPYINILTSLMHESARIIKRECSLDESARIIKRECSLDDTSLIKCLVSNINL